MWKIFPTCSSPQVAPSRSPERRSDLSKRFGPNLPIRRRVIWNGVALCPSLRSGLSVLCPVYPPNSVSSPILQKLSGVFEVRIYPEQYRIPNIVGTAKEADDSGYIWPSRISNGVDLNKLSAILDSIDYASIRRRRATYSRLYHEATSHQEDRGISFTDMLLLLAHHKIIVDREALVCVYHHTSASLY